MKSFILSIALLGLFATSVEAGPLCRVGCFVRRVVSAPVRVVRPRSCCNVNHCNTRAVYRGNISQRAGFRSCVNGSCR